METTAYVSNIQRFSVHDGPGIRTVVFLLGCPLRCKWCQNPETLKNIPQVMVNHEQCRRCGTCIKGCSQSAISIDKQGNIQIDRKKCIGCLNCIEKCPFEVLEASGKEYTINQVFDEVIKDKVFYNNTGGGLTISGGEPTMSPEFTRELLKICKDNGINTAIETCGYSSWERFEKILEVTDLFLYDFKVFDSEKHKKWTGVDNKCIKENLNEIVNLGKEVIIRIPLIPKVNDDKEEFTRMISYIKSLNKIKEIHILPFHQVGSSKYKMIDEEYELKDLDENNSENVDKCKEIAEKHGFIVSVGGSGSKKNKDFTDKITKRKKSFIYDI